MRVVLLTLGLTLGSGCMTYSLYDGEKRPKEELATLALGVIVEVDGQDLQYLTGHDLLVLPGRHKLGLAGDNGKGFPAACIFDVALKAGHVYAGEVKSNPAGKVKSPVISVVDRTADQVVARKPPLPAARAKTRAKAAVPARPARAAQTDNAAPAPRGQTLAPETLAELRRLRQLKTDGLITHEEYLQRGHALVDGS